VLLREGHEVLVEVERRHIGRRVRRIADDDRDGLGDGVDHRAAPARGKKAGVGSAGTDLITPPAMRKPKAWIG
jgi:hypothetical protein